MKRKKIAAGLGVLMLSASMVMFAPGAASALAPAKGPVVKMGCTTTVHFRWDAPQCWPAAWGAMYPSWCTYRVVSCR